jgi:hypothetical protein
MLVPDFSLFGGKHCETSSLMKVLRYHGHTFSEEMLLGIGGGVGFIYWHNKTMPIPFIGTRSGGRDNFLVKICERLGLSCRLEKTASSKKAHYSLMSLLSEGEPVIVYGDMAFLPYFRAPEGAHFGGHSFVVFGMDEAKGEAYISDRGANPITIDIDDLVSARGSKYPPSPPENKYLIIERGAIDVDLTSVIRKGIADCCRQMLAPPIANIGLKGMKKWASLVTSSWPKTFQGPRLLECLIGVFTNIQIGGTGGSAFRTLYARFLAEASRALNNEDLAAVAGKFIQAARCWDNISEAALPDSNPLLKRTRELLLEKNLHFEDQGPEALGAMDRIAHRLSEVKVAAYDTLSEPEIKDILQNIKASILECCSVEAGAIGELSAAVDCPARGYSISGIPERAADVSL